MKKIIIIDFSIGETFVLNYDSNVMEYQHIQDFFDIVNKEFDQDFKEANCQWMIVDEMKITML